MGKKRHVPTLHCSQCGKGFREQEGIVREVNRVVGPNVAEFEEFVVEAYCSEECNEIAEAAKLLACYGEPDKPSLIETALNLVQKMYEHSGSQPDHLVVAPATYKRLRKMLLRRSIPTKLGTDQHGVEVLEVNGVTIVEQPAVAPEKMYVLSSKAIRSSFALEGRIHSLEVKKKHWHG